ncbi:MAG: helix-turn-helix domain-containing protein [Bacillota bacterium]
MWTKSSGVERKPLPSNYKAKTPAEEALQNVLTLAKDMVGAGQGGIMFFDPDSSMLSLQYPAFDVRREMVEEYRVPADGVGAAVKAFRTRQPYISNRCSEDPNVIQRYVEMYRVEKLMTVPLECGSEVIGVWHLSNKRDGCGWEERDVNYFSAMAKRLSGLIDQTRQWQIKERRHQIWLSMMQKMAGTGDVQSVAEVLSHVLNFPVMVVDRWGFCRARVNFSAGITPPDEENLKKHFARVNPRSGLLRISPAAENKLSCQALAVPLRLARNALGCLVVMVPEDRPVDEILLSQAGMVLAVALNIEDRLTDVMERINSDFLDRLVGGRLDQDEACMRAGRLGLDLRRGWVTVLAVPDMAPRTDGESQNMWHRLHAARDELRREVENWAQECWVGLLGECTMVIWVEQPSKAAGCAVSEKLPNVVQQVLRRYVAGTTFSIGVGEKICSEATHFAEAFREAEQTVEIGRKLKGRGQVTFSSSLGSNFILYEAGQSKFWRAFSDRLIHRLEEYDRKHDAQLVGTLEAYLETGGSIAAAARLLHTHVNTVRYRLARVEEITGRSLKSASNRFDFQLTLQIKKLRD